VRRRFSTEKQNPLNRTRGSENRTRRLKNRRKRRLRRIRKDGFSPGIGGSFPTKENPNGTT
jgi:hypothetical protein